MSQRLLIKTQLRVIEECVRVQNKKTQCNTAVWVCIHPNETKYKKATQNKNKTAVIKCVTQMQDQRKQEKKSKRKNNRKETAVWAYIIHN